MEITIKIIDDLSGLKISVANAGVPISAEDREKIFNKFYVGKNAPTRDSNGIGLSIVKSVVALHKGGRCVDSESGLNTFTVTLPKIK